MVLHYQTVLVFLLLGFVAVVGGMIVLSLVRPKKLTTEKTTTYECGIDPVGDGQVRFDMRFYTIALIFVVFDVARERLTRDHWIYLPSHDLTVHRISEFKNFSELASPPDRTIVCAEITCRVGDRIWTSEAPELKATAVRDLEKLRLLDPEAVGRARIHRATHAYPLYDLTYKANVQVEGGVGRGTEFEAGAFGVLLDPAQRGGGRLVGLGHGHEPGRYIVLGRQHAATRHDLEGVLGIQTSAGLPGNPGVVVENGTLVIRGNAGEQNGIEITGNDFASDNAGSPLPLTFAETQAANGSGVYTSFSVYDSLGTPVTVNMTFALEATPNTGPKYFSRSSMTGWAFTVAYRRCPCSLRSPTTTAKAPSLRLPD